MKRFFSFFTLLSLLLPVLPARAAAFADGDLVKIASRSDVYYVGANAKRYVFPNEKTYFTWYTNFLSAKTISDADLASLQIGGAVTYRPGLKLVKVTTDPKVYAVAKGGVLRWITSESLAQALYGADWAMKVNDIPDEYFATYKVGANISSTSDYSPSAELAAATSIDVDRGLMAPTPTPTPTPTGAATLTLSKSPALAGDVVTLTATSTHPSGIAKIELFFDGTLVKTCLSASCSGDAVVPISGTKSSYETKAVATAVDGTQLISIVTLPIATSGSNLVLLTIGRPQIRQGQVGSAIVASDSSIAVIRTDIYLNGESVKACATASHECQWSDILSGPIGTIYDVYGKVTDSIGRTYTTPHKTITIASNDSPVVTVSPAKSLIYKGEMLDVTVFASDDDGIQSIEVTKDGVVLKHCDGPAPCTVTTGPWMAAGTLIFNGKATDGLGLSVTNGDTPVTVQ